MMGHREGLLLVMSTTLLWHVACICIYKGQGRAHEIKKDLSRRNRRITKSEVEL